MSQEIKFNIAFAKNKELLTEDRSLVTQALFSIEPLGNLGLSQGVSLTILLDKSTSMEGEKIKLAKEATIEVIKKIRPDDRLRVYTFSDRHCHKLIVDINGNEQEKEKAIGSINKVKALGSTILSYAMKDSLIAFEKDLGFIRLAWILSDGEMQENDDKKCLKVIQEFKAKEIPISFFGTSDYDRNFAHKIVEETNGRFVDLTNMDELQKVFDEELTDYQSISLSNLKLKIELNQGLVKELALVYPNIVANKINPSSDAEIALGHLSDTGFKALSIIEIPNIQQVGRFQLGKAYLKFDVPSSQQFNQKVEMPIIIEFTSNPAEINMNEEVQRAFLDYLNYKDVLLLTSGQSFEEKRKTLIRLKSRKTKIGMATEEEDKALKEINKTRIVSQQSLGTLIGKTRRTKISSN